MRCRKKWYGHGRTSRTAADGLAPYHPSHHKCTADTAMSGCGTPVTHGVGNGVAMDTLDFTAVSLVMDF